STVPPAPRQRAWLYGLLLLTAAAVVLVLAQNGSRAPAPAPKPEINQLRPAAAPGEEPAQPRAAEPEAPADPTPAAADPSAPEQPAQHAEAPAAEQPAAPSGEPVAEGGGDELDAAAVLEEARKLDEAGKAKQALALYESAAQRLPRNSTVLSRLAFGYLNRGRNNDAVNYAARAVDIDPTNSEGWIVLGAGKYTLGDRKAAKDAYRKCVDLGRGAYVAECKRMVR
ncbi:MAG TPA: tetratricopeptide repeat protein, partial [Polyangiales bacterium]|nr:tetratricopeptide repeat protein [Polyangiales bacterium]